MNNDSSWGLIHVHPLFDAECSLNFILGSIPIGADPMMEWFFVLFPPVNEVGSSTVDAADPGQSRTRGHTIGIWPYRYVVSERS